MVTDRGDTTTLSSFKLLSSLPRDNGTLPDRSAHPRSPRGQVPVKVAASPNSTAGLGHANAAENTVF